MAQSSYEERCLLDRIQLTLNHIEVYIGTRRELHRHGKRTHEEEKGELRGCHRILRFPHFSILPSCESSASPLLTDPFGLSVAVERNLSGARGDHAAPDWRLSARLKLLSPLRVNLQDYALLRGVLSHNLGAPTPLQAAQATSAATPQPALEVNSINSNEIPSFRVAEQGSGLHAQALQGDCLQLRPGGCGDLSGGSTQLGVTPTEGETADFHRR